MTEKTYKISTELKDFKSGYLTGVLEKIEGLKRSQFQVIKMCEYYSDSRYLEANYGNKNPLGRPVPFYNVVNFRVSLAKTATDLDIKDIQVVSDNPKQQTAAMILNREAYEWMKESEFSLTLNQMGSIRPKYGGYLVKKNTTNGKLKIDVVKWTNVYTNQTNILAGPIAELHYMSPVEIKGKDGTWNNVTEVLKAHKKIKPKDRPATIDVYEITGEFAKDIYNDATDVVSTADDEFTYSLQHYFVADVAGKQYVMFAEELSGKLDDYYEYLPWEDNGYGLGRGVIEDAEESQVWTNDAVINESIAMSLAGRVGIKTTSKKIGNSILEHDHGKVYRLENGEEMDAFSFSPAALGQYQAQIEKWRAQADNVTSSFNSITGGQPPANTPYSQTALLNQVATKPFEYRRQEWGIHLTKLFDKWVMPYLIKKLKKEHILVSDFTDQELDIIDESFANFNANNDIVEQVIKGATPSPYQQELLTNNYKKHVKKLGKKRFLEVPDNYFDGIEAKVTVMTTGEQRNKSLILQGLSDLMRDVIASFNPTTGEFAVLKDPTLSKLFNDRLELLNTGITPADIGSGASPTKQVAQAPMPTAMPAAAPTPA